MSSFFVGLLQIAFGLVVGACGLVFATRALSFALGIRDVEGELQRGNTAIAILEAGAALSLALLCQRAVASVFTAMDFLFRGDGLDLDVVWTFAIYATSLVGASLVLSAVCISGGVLLYGAFTRRVDEIAEIRRGNTAPAIAIAAMIVALALLVGPGFGAALDGLLPHPTWVDGEHQP